MIRCLLCSILLVSFLIGSSQEDPNCNSLGVWLWHLEGTSYPSYVNLANDLSDLGVNRVYVIVADGRMDSIAWPEIINSDIIDIFTQKGIEPWAWSYNYPNNEELQAEAIYVAAQTGYKGFVIDLESEFDGQTAILQRLASAFYNARNLAVSEGIVQDSMPLYVTTWGNPMDHNFHIELLDPYVDAYMPQTYLENWGSSFLEDPELWVDIGNEEYRFLGATKPINHIISMEHGNVTADVVNRFFESSGPMSSIWRIPGGGTPLSIRDVWQEVDWHYDFCDAITAVQSQSEQEVHIYPVPFSSTLSVETPRTCNVIVYNAMGDIVTQFIAINGEIELNTLAWQAGQYVVRIINPKQVWTKVVIKM